MRKLNFNLCDLGLVEGLQYQFRVSAVNEAGAGKPSLPSNVATAIDNVGAPQNLNVTDVTNNSISIAWQQPLEDGGSKIAS